MSVRSRRLAFAAVTAAAAIAVPTAALAAGSSASPGKPAPSAAATAAASKSTASKSAAAGGSAAAIKSAARQSAASSSATMSAMVTALATRLGVSHSAAQRVLNQVEALGREGIGPGSPAFAAIAHGLGVSSAQLSDALRAAKQSLAGR